MWDMSLILLLASHSADLLGATIMLELILLMLHLLLGLIYLPLLHILLHEIIPKHSSSMGQILLKNVNTRV